MNYDFDYSLSEFELMALSQKDTLFLQLMHAVVNRIATQNSNNILLW